MIDGIDGSGKSTIVESWKKYFEQKGKKVFDLRDFWKDNIDHPTPDDLMQYDIIFSGEPTHVWFGRAIRKEIIKTDSDYSALATANAYALDRLVLYKRLLLPLLKAGKTIIQDRGVSTSLCYQPVQDGTITMEEVASLEGNQFALTHRPDYLIIADLPVDVALSRLDTRFDKQDDARFEQKEFLQKARSVFLSKKYQALVKDHGTEVILLNTEGNIDIMQQNAKEFLLNIIN